MYKLVPGMNCDEHFSRSGIFFSVLPLEQEMAPILSLRASRGERKNRQLISREGLPERRSSVRAEVLPAIVKGLSKVKAHTFQIKWYGPWRLVEANHRRYVLVTYISKVSRQPTHAKPFGSYLRRPGHLCHKEASKVLSAGKRENKRRSKCKICDG